MGSGVYGVMMAADMTTEPSPAWEPGLVDLYRDRYGPMVRLAYLLTGSNEVAEELVQDAFVRVHRAWDRAASPPAYLRTTVVNLCRSHHRRRRLEISRRPRPDDDAVLVADELWDALARLPHRHRAALVLRFYEDLPDRDIAALLGCREATVRSSIHRGLARLRKEIEP